MLARVQDAIEEIEAQNEGGDDPPPPRLPSELQQAHALRERIQTTMQRLDQDVQTKRVNLTDEDALPSPEGTNLAEQSPNSLTR